MLAAAPTAFLDAHHDRIDANYPLNTRINALLSFTLSMSSPNRVYAPGIFELTLGNSISGLIEKLYSRK